VAIPGLYAISIVMLYALVARPAARLVARAAEPDYQRPAVAPA